MSQVPHAAPTARPASTTAVRPLRTRILRPDWPAGRLLAFAEDDDARTVHVAAGKDGRVVGVGTVYLQSPPAPHRGAISDDAYASGAAWQLRGMATDVAVRGAGFGAAVLAACVAAVRSGGGRVLWCNARLAAVPFYHRAGFVAVGDEFDVAGIGPHVVMWQAV